MIGAGGTGGHIYPALAVAEALQDDEAGEHDLVFVGAVGGMEAGLARASGLDFSAFHALHAGPLHGVSPPRMLHSCMKLTLGTMQAIKLLRECRPQALLLTGGWANLPLALASRLLGIPSVVYLPDIEPGLTIRVLRHFARRIAITVGESARYFAPGKSVLTGYPLGQSRLTATRAAALRHFGLDGRRKTLLVFGGSQGARSINMAFGDILEWLLADGWQTLHVTGELDWDRSQKQLGKLAKAAHYHGFPYLHDDMGLALAAADLALCRAGASVLGELPHFGAPAILVPYPYAWRYQKVNADYLSERGAALRLDDADMAEQLYPTIKSLHDDESRLTKMRANSKALATADGARRLAQLLIEVGEVER